MYIVWKWLNVWIEENNTKLKQTKKKNKKWEEKVNDDDDDDDEDDGKVVERRKKKDVCASELLKCIRLIVIHGRVCVFALIYHFAQMHWIKASRI